MVRFTTAPVIFFLQPLLQIGRIHIAHHFLTELIATEIRVLFSFKFFSGNRWDILFYIILDFGKCDLIICFSGIR